MKIKDCIVKIINEEFNYSPAKKSASRLWYIGFREIDIIRSFKSLSFPDGVDSTHLIQTRNELRDIERGFSKPIKESEL